MRRRIVFLALVALTFACVLRHPPEVRDLSTGPVGAVETPVRAHLFDLSSVFFGEGVVLAGDSLVGRGEAFDVRGRPLGSRTVVPMDSVAGLESLSGRSVRVAETVLASTGIAAGTVLVGAALAVAAFGSCPTYYAATAEGHTLEAEGFAYSISPLLEGRDVDVLRSVAAIDGSLELEIRNEALETHFVNHVELLAATVDDGERLVPDAADGVLAVGALAPVGRVTDASGRDVGAAVATADGSAYETPTDRIREAREGDPFDRLLLQLPASEGSEVALVLRLRNSLLTTLLFYDLMLAPAGIEAIDWMVEDAERIDRSVEMAFWAREYMGLRVEVEEAEGWREVARVADTGPIAWEEVAVSVPVQPERPTRVRLSFLADAWRIDHLAVADSRRRPEVRRVPVTEVEGPFGESRPDVVAALAAPDESYLETRPTQRMTLRFAVGRADDAYLLASQGYYTEWIRPGWIRNVTQPRRFAFGRASMSRLHDRWLREGDELERRFFSSTVPVR